MLCLGRVSFVRTSVLRIGQVLSILLQLYDMQQRKQLWRQVSACYFVRPALQHFRTKRTCIRFLTMLLLNSTSHTSAAWVGRQMVDGTITCERIEKIQRIGNLGCDCNATNCVGKRCTPTSNTRV